MAVAVVAAGVLWRRDTTSSPATFVGSATCARCHPGQFAAWQRSQHAVSMRNATPAAVLGQFDARQFSQNGATYTFRRRGDTSVVTTAGADGARHDYPIRYTFGVWPLQQYLIDIGRGHVQALPVAWDARPAAGGGQRWFSLTPGVEPAYTDRFHWTGRQYNWNYMCADCHSTAVRKRYDASADSFATEFSEISVGCEACHGPGSRHAAWGGSRRVFRSRTWRTNGLQASLTERRGAAWSIDSTTGNARRNHPRTTDHEIETCAQCHARRVHIADGYTAGAPMLDFYAPLPLAAPLYYPDGQQRDEVYTYASFAQSRMYGAGVTCADCHEPHTQKPRAPGNQVCAQCHRPAKYDTSAHHFHTAGSTGAQCVSCHMPDTTYMEIDRRHDHSLRIPRPDLSVALGVPNACTRCHADRGAQWAADAVKRWYPRPNPGFQRFARAFAADDRGDAGAADSLAALLRDTTQPWIVRASALVRAAAYPNAATLAAAQRASGDDNGVVRLAALQVLDAFGDAQRRAIAVPLLADPRRAVRQEAARLVAPIASTLTDSAQRRAFDAAAAEFVAAQRYNADRAPSRLRLVAFYGELNQFDSAAAEFRAAATLDAGAAADFTRALAAAAASNARAAAMLRAIGGVRLR